MADIAEMANIDTVDFKEVNGVLSLGLAFYSIVIGGYAEHQYAGDFILAGALDSVGAGNSLGIRVGGVVVGNGNDIRSLLAEGITGSGREGVGNNDGLAASDAETRMT